MWAGEEGRGTGLREGEKRDGRIVVVMHVGRMLNITSEDFGFSFIYGYTQPSLKIVLTDCKNFEFRFKPDTNFFNWS